MLEFETHFKSLPNHVRSLEIRVPHDETAICAVMTKSGSRNETSPKERGINHAIEHKVYRGTIRHTGKEYGLALDRIGSDSNAETDKEYTMYYLDTEAKHFEKSLELLSEPVVEPTFPYRGMKKENGVLAGEIADYTDDFAEITDEAFESILYGRTPMSKPILGTKDSVKAHTKRDLKRYMSKWYRGENVLVITAGRVARTGKLVEKYFGKLPPGPVDDEKIVAKWGKERTKIITKQSNQAYFTLGVPGISIGDPRYYTLKVIDSIFDFNRSGRLFSKLREREGLVYDASTLLRVDSGGGYFAVKASVQPRLLTKTLNVVKNEMFKFSKTVTREEVARAKEMIRGDLLRRLRDTINLVEIMGIPALFLNVVEQPREMLEKIDKVRLSDVRKLADQILIPEEARLVILGPVDKDLKKVKR